VEIDALMCDHAQVAAGKLFISGGSIDVVTFPVGHESPFALTFAIAGVVRVPWTATDSDHSLQFMLLDSDGRAPALMGVDTPEQGIGGEMTFNVGRPPGLPAGDEQQVPFAFQFVGLPLARPGQYAIAIGLDGEASRSISFRVAVAAPPPKYGATDIPGIPSL